MTAAASGASPTIGERPVPTVKFAYRDLFRRGAQTRTAAMPDHTQGRPRKVPFGAKSFDDPSLLPGHAKHAILSLQGVTGVEELAVGFVAWRKLSGGGAAPLLGSDARNKRSLPENGIAASITERALPHAGGAPIAGAALGLNVVIPAPTLYSRTKEHVDALAMRRALGAFSGFIRPVTLLQTVLRAIMGYLKGVPPRLLLIFVWRDAAPLIVMTTNSALLLSALTVGMCVFAPSSAITITGIDPAGFSR
jgi:hypothetical protein